MEKPMQQMIENYISALQKIYKGRRNSTCKWLWYFLYCVKRGDAATNWNGRTTSNISSRLL